MEAGVQLSYLVHAVSPTAYLLVTANDVTVDKTGVSNNMNSDWRTDDQGATPVSNFEASKTMGQIAFEAYWNKKGWMRRNQETIHSWDRQKADEIEAWEEVAVVILENVTDEITNILGAMNRTHPYFMDDPEYWNRTPVK